MLIFQNSGIINTEIVVDLALKTAKEQNIKHIVIASYTGYTADFFKNHPEFNRVVVRGIYGFKEVNTISMSEEKYQELQGDGMKIVTAGHVLSGVERAFSAKFSGIYPAEIMAYTLRMFGQGTKVCVECATMACDAGTIPAGERVLCVAGTGKGADTALIIEASTTQRMLDTRIVELLCKPQ